MTAVKSPSTTTSNDHKDLSAQRMLRVNAFIWDHTGTDVSSFQDSLYLFICLLFILLFLNSNFFSGIVLPVLLLLLLFSHSLSCVWLFVTPGLQHPRLPCPSWSPGVNSDPCPLSRWCHPTILSSVTPLSLCPQSFPASGSFPISQMAKLLELQHQFFQWIFRTDFL